MAEPRDPGSPGYPWLTWGDLNGFFGLMFDNLTVMSFLAGILVFGFQFPAAIVYQKMLPGTAVGVLFGDLVYTWMAFRLARRTGSRTVTAMPLGLDTPSTIGIALAVLGPAFLGYRQKGIPPEEAATRAWQIGMATMMMMGVLKTALSFVGDWVRRAVPQAGLLGSLAGIGLALIGFLPIVHIFGVPLVGLMSLGLVLFTVVARIRLPLGIPGVLAAVAVGSCLYYALAPQGLAGGTYVPPSGAWTSGVPRPTLGFIQGFIPALTYLPIALPFALLTVIGGINVTESARVAGDDFDTKEILLTEALATLVAGLFGGVAQTTPYIGHPAYKHMGSRAGYTLATGLFVGLGTMLGGITFVIDLVPQAAMAPILVFVALEIVSQSFVACPARHAPAVAFAFLPTVAQLLQIKLSTPEIVPPERFGELLKQPGKELPELLVTVALGNGFVLTGMLWGALVAFLIDRKLRIVSAVVALLGGLAYFGIVHSALPDGSMYFPWTLPAEVRRIPNQFSAAYLALAALFLVLSFTRGAAEPAPEEPPEGALRPPGNSSGSSEGP